jgi:hypothetical protein
MTFPIILKHKDEKQNIIAGAYRLARCIKFYIPSESDKVIFDHSSIVRFAARILSDICGGATVLPHARGAWVNDAGLLIEETISIVYAFYDDESKIDAAVQWAHYLKNILGQDSLAIENNGELYLI